MINEPLGNDAPHLPGYTVLSKLGAGGMGDVFLAQTQSGDRFAVKVWKDSPAADDTKRQQREATLLREMSHPNIVRVFDSGEYDGRSFLIMEWVEGKTLRARLSRAKPLPLEEVRHILKGLAKALSCLHGRKIIHRDLKPENVLIDGDGHLKLTDFGIAVSLEQIGRLTAPGTVLGTLDYMSPEQRHGLQQDERSDQFSVATMTYEMLTGRIPAGRFRPPSQLNRGLSPRVDQVLLRALSDDPDDRFDHFSEFAQQLDAALEQVRYRHACTRLVALLCLLLAITGILVVATNDQSQQSFSAAIAAVKDKQKKQSSLDINYLAERAHDHVQRRNYVDAIRCYDQALLLNEKLPEVYFQRAFCLWKSGRLWEALGDLEASRKFAPAVSPEIGRRQAEIQMQLGDLPVALETIDENLDVFPEDAASYALKGRILTKLDRPAESFRQFQLALDIDDHCGEAYHYRALYFKRAGKTAKEIADLEQAMECMPENAFIPALLAAELSTCRDRTFRDPPRARQLGKRACEMSHWREPQTLRALAAAEILFGQWDYAVQLTEEAYELAPLADRVSIGKQLDYYRRRRDEERRKANTVPH